MACLKQPDEYDFMQRSKADEMRLCIQAVWPALGRHAAYDILLFACCAHPVVCLLCLLSCEARTSASGRRGKPV